VACLLGLDKFLHYFFSFVFEVPSRGICHIVIQALKSSLLNRPRQTAQQLLLYTEVMGVLR
jgi:hypothetical protein